MHNDWLIFIRDSWWVIFPLSWLIMGAMGIWSRHSRANRIIDLIKHYADQGKEPPPELLVTLQEGYQRNGRSKEYGNSGDWGSRTYGYRGPYSWMPVFLFAAIAAGFLFMAWNAQDAGRTRIGGLIFVAFIMGGLALGNLVAVLMSRRDDRDRNLPK